MLIKYTKKEEQEIQRIREKFIPKLQECYTKLTEAKEREERNAILAEITLHSTRMQNKLNAYTDTCQRKRFNKFKGDPARIISNAREQAPQILKNLQEEIQYRNRNSNPEFIKELQLGQIKDGNLLVSAILATDTLKDEFKLHLSALADNQPAQQEIMQIITETIENSPIIDHETPAPLTEATTPDIEQIVLSLMPDSMIYNTNMVMHHGKAIDMLAAFSYKDIKLNKLRDTAIVEDPVRDFTLMIQEVDKLKAELGVNTHKLLSLCVCEYTRTHTPRIAVPFLKYAELSEINIENKESLKSFRKRTAQQLNLMASMHATFKEEVRHKTLTFDRINYFERVRLDKDYIIATFTPTMAEYLKLLPETPFHRGLFAINGKKPNAYRIGNKINTLYNMDNNIIQGTAGISKVKTLLDVTDLPTIEDLQNEKKNNRRQWYTRIKEPFEKAMDELTGKVIKDWEYTRGKGIPLTDEEAYNITDYETFINLYVKYELIDAPDHTERLERRAVEKALAEEKSLKRKQKKRTKKKDPGKV